jgi:hypothetical protein
MIKYLAGNFLPTLESSTETWRSRWKTWTEDRRLRAAAKVHCAIVANLDARIQHDIGESDCRVLSCQHRPALPNAQARLAEELQKWSI